MAETRHELQSSVSFLAPANKRMELPGRLILSNSKPENDRSSTTALPWLRILYREAIEAFVARAFPRAHDEDWNTIARSHPAQRYRVQDVAHLED